MSNMPWPTKKLGEVIKLQYGKGIAKDERKPSGKYPVYGANGVLDYTDKYLVEGEAIIIGRKGSAGEVTRVSGKFWSSDVTYYVFGNEKIDTDYLFHALKSLNLQRLAVGVKPGINRNRVYELQIPLPPLAEQKKIVAKLEEVLGKISEAKKLREEAQTAAGSLLAAELHKIFKEGKKKGWEEEELGKVIDYEQPTDYIVNSTDYSNINKTPVLTAGKTFIKGYTNEKKGIFPEDKLPVIIFDDFTTAIQFVDFPFKVKSSAMKILNAKEDKANVKFLFYLMQTIKLNHTTHKRYWISEYSKIKIPLPPLAEQKKIVARLDTLSEKVSTLQKIQAETENDLVALEQSVLHHAFAG